MCKRKQSSSAVTRSARWCPSGRYRDRWGTVLGSPTTRRVVTSGATRQKAKVRGAKCSSPEGCGGATRARDGGVEVPEGCRGARTCEPAGRRQRLSLPRSGSRTGRMGAEAYARRPLSEPVASRRKPGPGTGCVGLDLVNPLAGTGMRVLRCLFCRRHLSDAPGNGMARSAGLG